MILGAVFLQTLTNLLVALGWGDAGKWVGFGVVLYVLLIVYVAIGAGGRPERAQLFFGRCLTGPRRTHYDSLDNRFGFRLGL